MIGGAIGGIVGAVGYTAYVAATGKEFNSSHFWMATGGGAVAGALIGTGVGAAEGLTVAGATTAAVEAGTAVEGANIACGGDMCSGEAQQATNAVEEAGPALENAVTQVGDDVASSAQQTINKVDQVANDLEEWLGDNLVAARNESGDFWIRNAENTRKFRFDFFKTYPHESPHMHLQWLDEFGDWVGKRIFPNDVAPK